MSENYFESIRTVGASLDQGISKLQEKWEMPHLFLCNKDNEETQTAAKKLVKDLANDVRLLKENVEEESLTVICMLEQQNQFLQESIKAIKSLKAEVDDIQILFKENGYVEESVEDELSSLYNNLDPLSLNNDNSFSEDSTNNVTDSYVCDSASFNDSLSTSRNFADVDTPERYNISSSKTAKKSLMNKPPMEPLYSPHYYKSMKK